MANNLGLEPAISKFQEKAYSLQPDMINGWRAKTKIFKQIPIRYLYQPVEKITKQYTKFGVHKKYRVIYLGPRHNSNLKVMKSYFGREYDKYSKEACVYGVNKLSKYQYKYHKQKEKIFNLPMSEHRIFLGMNPSLQEEEDFTFDSDFQSGNLDLVMKIQPFIYDIFMRVDSNTKGHTSWYFFRVKTKNSAGQNLTLNICNFTKKNLLYAKGMRPYVLSKLSGGGWKQDGFNVFYQKKKFRYQICEDISKQYYNLSFTYQIQHNYDQIYFAYCIPYSYSYLLHFIKQLVQQPNSKQYLKDQYLFQSPSGLKIPLLTISNFSQKQKKKIILVTGRLHPGQTQGSWMMHGFLKFLCSQSAKKLRNYVIFKIIPMVNVDGVVLGNFRTGLKGLDLNRLFKCEQSDKYFEIDYIKQLANQSKQNLLMYFDFHGHSTKKSVFIYGPQYKLGESNYFISRIMPKMISKATQMFRFYACIFKISKQKQTTARAIMFRQNKVPYCYTVQASTHSYTTGDGQIIFTSDQYVTIGKIICSQLEKLILMFVEVENRKEQKRKQRQKKKQKQLNANIYDQTNISDKKQQRKKGKDNKKKSFKMISPKGFQSILNNQDQNFDNPFNQFISEIKNDINKKQQIASQGSSDCQSDAQDYSKEQLQIFFNQSNKSKKKFSSPSIKPNQLKQTFNKNNNNKFIKQTISITTRERSQNGVIELGKQKQLLSQGSLPQIRYQKNKRNNSDLLDQNIQKKKTWINYLGKSKVTTIQQKQQQKQIFTDKEKVFVRQGYIINLKMQSDVEIDKNNQQPIVKRQKSYSKSNLPQINKKFEKKKIDILNSYQQIELPNVISEIVKNHLRNQDIKSKRLNKSIQVIRL